MPISDFGYSMTAHFLTIPKRIKKRLRIEKLAVGLISVLAVCGALLMGLVYLINDYESMDMNKYKILDNVSVTERDNALWLNVKGFAASFDVDVPTLSDSNGKHLGIDDDFESEKKNCIRYLLTE